MKLNIKSIFLLFLVSSVLNNITKTNSHIKRLSTRASENDLRKFASEKIVKSATIPTRDGKDEINSDVDIDKIKIDDIIGLKSSRNVLPKFLDWNDTKNFFLVKDKEIMKKYLLFRLIDLKYMFLEILKDSNIFKNCDNKPAFVPNLKGNLKFFRTEGCIKFPIKVGAVETFIEGSFHFSMGGSETFSSDIDLNVDFRAFETKNSGLIYKRLKAVASFIQLYNSKFYEYHNTSSAKAFDVNLYSLNFAYKSFISRINNLKKEHPTDYNKFLAANRLSVLILLFKDSFEIAEKKDSRNISLPANVDEILSQMKTLASSCGDTLIEGNKFIKRPSDDMVRNQKMVERLNSAADIGLTSNDSNTFASVCNVLTANFYALESYIPIGSLVDIMILQGLLDTVNNLKVKEFWDDVDNNFIVDTVFMNFAYGVEHYYEFITDKTNADKKFAKYMARAFGALSNLKNEQEHKQCWLKNFTDNFDKNIVIYKTFDIKEFRDLSAKILIKLETDKTRETTKKFIREGYKCVLKHGLSLTKNVVPAVAKTKVSKKKF
jgi:hypothetical protein